MGCRLRGAPLLTVLSPTGVHLSRLPPGPLGTPVSPPTRGPLLQSRPPHSPGGTHRQPVPLLGGRALPGL